MAKVCTKHILRLLWKMVENTFFLENEHVGMGEILPSKKLTISIKWRETN